MRGMCTNHTHGPQKKESMSTGRLYSSNSDLDDAESRWWQKFADPEAQARRRAIRNVAWHLFAEAWPAALKLRESFLTRTFLVCAFCPFC